MSEIISLEHRYNYALEKAIEILTSEDILIYPTDTVYGIGGIATSKNTMKKINILKKRNEFKPSSILLGNLNQLFQYFNITNEDMNYINMYMPGPYTFILEAKPEFAKNYGMGYIGVRIPDHYFIRKLAIEIEAPIITTSANISGNATPTSIEEIDKTLLEQVPLIIDGGYLKYSHSSTVVDLKAKKIIRQGAGQFQWLDKL